MPTTDTFIIPPPESAPAANPDTNIPKPKSGKKKWVLLVGLVLLIITLPVAIYYITQSPQFAEIRSRACSPAGSSCGKGGDCCSGNCYRAQCQGGALPTKPPTGNTPTKSPTGNTPTKSPTCKPSGASCGTGSECCSTNCYRATCQGAAFPTATGGAATPTSIPGCVGTGKACNWDVKCCSLYVCEFTTSTGGTCKLKTDGMCCPRFSTAGSINTCTSASKNACDINTTQCTWETGGSCPSTTVPTSKPTATETPEIRGLISTATPTSGTTPDETVTPGATPTDEPGATPTDEPTPTIESGIGGGTGDGGTAAVGDEMPTSGVGPGILGSITVIGSILLLIVGLLL